MGSRSSLPEKIPSTFLEQPLQDLKDDGEQIQANWEIIPDKDTIDIACKNGGKQFASTNASAALESLIQMIKSGWMPQRPIVIALFGAPGTGKTEMVRRFAEDLWQFFVQKKGKQNFTKFSNFFKEHNFATMPNKEAISKFVGTSRGIEGGKGDLVIDLANGAQVFYLDEFEKANAAIIKAFGGLFEDGEITDNSGAYAQCTSPTFFFISGNYSSEDQEELAKTIIELPAFLKTRDQSQLDDADLKFKLQEFKKKSFSGDIGFIGDRCFMTLLTYRPKSLDFCIGLATKFLHDAAAQVERKYLIGWRYGLAQNYAKKIMQSHRSNRDWRNEILRDMLHSLSLLKNKTLENKMVIFSSEGQPELLKETPEMKQKADNSQVEEELIPQTKAEIENAIVGQDPPQEIIASSRRSKTMSKSQSKFESETRVPTILGMTIVILLTIIAAQSIY